MMSDDRRRALPSVSRVLALDGMQNLVKVHGHQRTVGAVRDVLQRVRQGHIVADGDLESHVASAVKTDLDRQRDRRARRVVNATGVVLHTNLGRASLSPAAIQAVVDAAGPTTVEFDLETLRRASRGAYARQLLRELTGAEDAMVVNNGAAALVLTLAVLARGQRVAVSRGELVEIGGSFRLPAIIEAAGVDLVEVGTTNRTRTGDYETAIAADPGIAAILRVHPSNFHMGGFVHRPAPEELARAARAAEVPLIHDVGSGVISSNPISTRLDPGEPTMSQALIEGADVVIASGDKLLGGPQAGLVLGDLALIRRCRQHPLARAMRVDKLRLAALESTLEAHQRGDLSALPTWSMLDLDIPNLRSQAECLQQVAHEAGLNSTIVETEAVVGGGSMPSSGFPSVGIALHGDSESMARRLADADPPVIARTIRGRVILDLCTVRAEDATHLAALLRDIGRRGSRVIDGDQA